MEFWKPKLEANRERDIKHKRQLTRLGWRYLVIWECESRDTEALEVKIVEFLEDQG